jgi:AcrR family transcriptional regulator
MRTGDQHERNPTAADGTVPARPRKTRASPRGEARRREIIAAATRMFSERGFDGATYSELAEAVGISQAGLLHHFPSKRELLLAVLRDRDEQNAADARRRQAAGEDFLTAFVDILRENEANPVLVQLFGLLSAESIREDHPAHDYFVTRYQELVQQATDALRDTVDEDALPEGATTETVARWIIGAADGIRLQWLLDPTAMGRADALALLIEALRPYFKDADRES